MAGVKIMPQESEESAADLAFERLNAFLASLADSGVTQAQVAVRAGIPVPYLSDVKKGRRPLTELLARRLAEEFDVNFKWLLGTESAMARPKIGTWVPIFGAPVEGEPRAHPRWDGTGLEIAGAAAAKLAVALQPYVLRFNHNDSQGRIRQGDLILVSQAANPDAEISVVRYRNKCFLARRNKSDGEWIRIATREKLPAGCPIVGHCLGIVWASLC
jgi:transcriptional regulator with XRE-family HTH domain